MAGDEDSGRVPPPAG